MDIPRKPQFLSAALGPDLYLALTEELQSIGDDSTVMFTCLPDVGLEAHRYGLSAVDTVSVVRELAHDMFRPGGSERRRINEQWQHCVDAMMRGYYCSSRIAKQA